MVTEMQGSNVFSRTLRAAKYQMRRTSLQGTRTHLATTPISTGNILRQ